MPKVGESVLTFDAYEDGTDYYGMAEVKLPDVSNLTTTVSGAGISGNVEASILGFVDAMSMTMNFRTVTETSFRLAEPRRHTLDLRAVQQEEDVTTGEITKPVVKYIVVVTPKKLGLGTLKPASPADVSGEYSVSYIAAYINGKKMLEIDPYNFIYYVNGTDYLAEVRNAIGK